ncbi:MAG: SMP-30/gluconolactonase/LRE family protein [Streptosporangiaceae bacterium]
MTRILDAEIAVPARCELAEGPAWDAARGLLRWVDILAGRVHAAGQVSGAHTWFEVGGPPDGLTLDAEGCLWLAVWGSGELRRYTPDGRLDTVVRLPVSQVTSAAFGGAGLSTLYITTARENFTPADLRAQPHAGDIFACTPGVTGRLPYLFDA